MKEETKELIKWIKNHIAMKAEETFIPYDNKRAQAEIFLDSLPEIESHLCRGGYIQDNSGTPCGHGDKISFLYRTSIFTGTLTWIPNMGKFLIKPDSDFFKYHKKADEYLTFYDIQAELNGFSKVNEVVE